MLMFATLSRRARVLDLKERPVPVRPLIGVAMQTLEPIAGQLPLCWVMGQRYVRVLTAAGAVPWLIPLLQDDEPTLRCIYDQLDGVFLTGGVDVDPAQYGEARHERCGKTDPPRDWTEMRLIRWARADDKPVLGVCRGIQVINVAAGGTLYQDLPTQRAEAIKHDYFPTEEGYERDSLVHETAIVGESNLARIMGVGSAQVNSMHHQGIKELAADLVPTAVAPDGLIEGVEGRGDPFLIGVQWHPEELTETRPDMERLFAAFVEASRDYRRRRDTQLS
jgi:putative glutamine amidotransferase